MQGILAQKRRDTARRGEAARPWTTAIPIPPGPVCVRQIGCRTPRLVCKANTHSRISKIPTDRPKKGCYKTRNINYGDWEGTEGWKECHGMAGDRCCHPERVEARCHAVCARGVVMSRTSSCRIMSRPGPWLLWLAGLCGVVAGCGDQVRRPSPEEVTTFEMAGPSGPSVDMDRVVRARIPTGPYRVAPGDILELQM